MPQLEPLMARGSSRVSDVRKRRVRAAGYASTHNIGLVAMGTRGQHHLKEMWLGSVAASVVRDAPCTVLVARPLTNGH
jgi:nucleotide-binding universal stress UspA family protein